MSIIVSAIEFIKEMGRNADPDDVVEYVSSLTKTTGSALVQLSGLRKALHTTNNPVYITLADELLKSPVYEELKMKAREDANNNLIAGSDSKDEATQIGLNKLGGFKEVLTVLHSIVDDLRDGKRDVNIRDLLYTIINFSARPIDVFQMEFKDGYLSNWGKQRLKGNPKSDTGGSESGGEVGGKAEYIGYLNDDDAAFLLDKVQEHYNRGNRSMSSIERDMRNASMKLFGVNPRDLRRISSIILSSTEKNRIKRIQKQQAILRHKKPITSVLYYS